MLPGHQYYSLLAMAVLIFFFSFNIWFLSKWDFEYKTNWSNSFSIKNILDICIKHKTLVIGLIAYSLLQLFPLIVAPIGLGDPIGLALAGPHLLSPLWSIAYRLGIPVILIRLFIIGSTFTLIWLSTRKFSIKFFKSLWFQIKKPTILSIIIFFFIVFILCYSWVTSSLFQIESTLRNVSNAPSNFSWHWLLLSDLIIDPPITLHREPPFGRLVLIISTLIFGANEVAVRLPQLLFVLGTIVYIYRIVNLYKTKDIALLSAFIFGLMPPVFYYAHLAWLVGGLLFFMVASSYYFLRHVFYHSREDLLKAIYILAIGSLYNRPAILLFGIFIIYILISSILKIDKLKLKLLARDYILSIWLFLITIIPWLVIVGVFTGPGRFVRYKYSLSFSNYLSFDFWIGYLEQLPFQLGWVMTILIALAFCNKIFFNRDRLFIFTFIWFIVYYIFFTGDDYGQVVIGHDRFALIWYPCLAIWVGEFILNLKWIRESRLLRIGFISILLLHLGLSSTLFRNGTLNIHYASYLDALSIFSTQSAKISKSYKNRQDWGETRLPYGKLYKFLKQNENIIGRILINDSREVMQLYSYKYELKLNVFDNTIKKFKSEKELIGFCKKHDIEYILLENGYTYKWDRLSDKWLEPNFFDELKNENFKPFIIIERFNLGTNSLFLLKVPSI